MGTMKFGVTKTQINEIIQEFCERENIKESIQVETLIHPMNNVYIAKVSTKEYDQNNQTPFQETDYPSWMEDLLLDGLEYLNLVTVTYTTDDELLIILIE